MGVGVWRSSRAGGIGLIDDTYTLPSIFLSRLFNECLQIFFSYPPQIGGELDRCIVNGYFFVLF